MTTQQRPRRRVLTYSNVVATAALVLATTGAGVAADAAGSGFIITKLSQIKPSVAKKLSGRVGPQGQAGPAGPQGSPGARGADATGPVPYGKTITGAFYEAGTPQTVYTIPLPMPLATKPTSEQVNFAPDTNTATVDDDTSCTGTYANPTAPAGKVCVYAPVLSGVSNAVALSFAEPNLRDRGVYLGLTLSGTSATFYGSWAYTAP